MEKQLEEANTNIAHASNKIQFDLIPMSRKIKDDPEMLAFVDQCLSKDKELRVKSFLPLYKK